MSEKGLKQSRGFNSDLFSFGMHVGSQPNLGGFNPQELLSGSMFQQFQDPYSTGQSNAPYFNNQMGQGQPPDVPGMDSYAPNMGADPNQQMGQPPDQPPQGGGSFWQNAGQYLTSQNFKDSLMSGIIAGQMATDPKSALQMAMQWRQQRDQRNFQGQQNQLQREQQQEMMKQRAEVEKENKKGADLTKRIAKIQAGLQAGNVPPQVVQQWIAENGPPDENNIGKAETDFALMQSQIKAEERNQKEMKQVLGFVLKGAKVPEKYKNDPIMQSVEGLGKERKSYTDQIAKSRLDISELRRKLYAKALGKGDDDTNKAAFRLALTDLDDANTLVNNAITDVDTLEEEARLLGGDEVLAAVSAKRFFLQKAINNYNEKHQTAADMVGSQGKSVTVPTPTAPKKKNRVGAALGLDE